MLHVRIPDTINIERELSIAARVNKNAFFVLLYFSIVFSWRASSDPTAKNVTLDVDKKEGD